MAAIAAAAPSWLLHGRSRADGIDQTDRPGLRLLDWLNRAEREEVISGRNNFDVAARLNGLLREAPDGALVDATALHGNAELLNDPFAGIEGRNIAIATAAVTLRKDFNQGPLTLPSRLAWMCDGTRILPSRKIKHILTDASPAAGMIATSIAAGRCSGRKGERSLVLSSNTDADGLLPGARIAIFATRIQPTLEHTIEHALTPDTRSFGFVEPVNGTIDGSLIYLGIGQETLLGQVFNGRIECVEPGGRGALGTIAAAHPAGARASVLLSTIAVVESVSGRHVTLDRPLPRSIVAAPFRAGTIGAEIIGKLTVDGGFASGEATPFCCLATTLSTGFTVGGGVVLRRASHGGVVGFGCADARISIDEIAETGRPNRSLGGSVWLFGSAVRNHVQVGRARDGYAAFFVDDKSNGVSRYALEGSCRDNLIEITKVQSHSLAGQISGSSGNRVYIGSATTTESAAILDAGMGQSTEPVATGDNLIQIDELVGARTVFGDAKRDNKVRIGFEEIR